jgi:chloramphenicol 3-O-phosphotransferase
VSRRPNNHGGPARLAEQHSRLAHARAHCDLYLDTSHLAPTAVLEQVLAFLNQVSAVAKG